MVLEIPEPEYDRLDKIPEGERWRYEAITVTEAEGVDGAEKRIAKGWEGGIEKKDSNGVGAKRKIKYRRWKKLDKLAEEKIKSRLTKLKREYWKNYKGYRWMK